MTQSNVALIRPSDEELSDLLGRLATKQREEFEERPFQPEDFNRRKPVLAEFRETLRFWEIYHEAFRYLLVPRTDEECETFEHELAGKLFEDLAYSWLAGKEYPPVIVLSPERTLTFYKSLHPDSNPLEHPFHDSLKGISVPDGLIIEEHDGIAYIVAVCEYTTSGSNVFTNKYNGFDIDKRNKNSIFGDAQLLFVVLNATNVPEDILNNVLVDIQQMPFTHSQFRNFVDDVYRPKSNPNDGEPASLFDIQERSREQLDRLRDYHAKGSLPPGWGNYERRLRNESIKV